MKFSHDLLLQTFIVFRVLLQFLHFLGQLYKFIRTKVWALKFQYHLISCFRPVIFVAIWGMRFHRLDYKINNRQANENQSDSYIISASSGSSKLLDFPFSWGFLYFSFSLPVFRLRLIDPTFLGASILLIVFLFGPCSGLFRVVYPLNKLMLTFLFLSSLFFYSRYLYNSYPFSSFPIRPF